MQQTKTYWKQWKNLVSIWFLCFCLLNPSSFFSVALQSRLPQFGDNRCLDLFVDGHSSNPPTSSVVRSQTPQFVNARSFPPQDMYGGVRIVRPQSASGATSMFPDGHLSTAQVRGVKSLFFQVTASSTLCSEELKHAVCCRYSFWVPR